VAKGQKDFGLYAPTDTIVGVSDMGELAARLGSPDVFDRRGNVVFIDSFENDLIPYTANISGAGASIKVVTDHARTGSFSCKMVTGSDGVRLARLQKFLAYPALTKWGFEIGFTFLATMEQYLLTLIFVNGTSYTSFAIRVDPINDKFQYISAAGAWVDIASGLELYAEHDLFNFMKLVVNLEDKTYARATLNEQAFSLADIPSYQYTDTAGHFLLARVDIVGIAGNNYFSYLDEFIVTQNEP